MDRLVLKKIQNELEGLDLHQLLRVRMDCLAKARVAKFEQDYARATMSEIDNYIREILKGGHYA